MSNRKTYQNPPITERIIGVYTQIKQEVFEAKMPAWAKKIESAYPLSRPISEWTIKIKEVKGLPVLQNVEPQAEIIHLFWKPHPKKLLIHGMRVRPDRLVFHLEREPGKIHDFDELYKEMESWIDKWMEHFEVTSLRGVTLEYANRLNASVTPQFVLPDGQIKLSEVFVLFADVPGRYKTLTKPYDCKVRLVVDSKQPLYFDIRVRAEDDARDGVAVQFVVNTIGLNKEISAKESLAEIQQGHEVMQEQFDCFFTEKAKESFGKNAISDSSISGESA